MENYTEIAYAEAGHLTEKYTPLQLLKLFFFAYKTKPKDAYTSLLLAIDRKQIEEQQKADAEHFAGVVRAGIIVKYLQDMLDGEVTNDKQK